MLARLERCQFIFDNNYHWLNFCDFVVSLFEVWATFLFLCIISYWCFQPLEKLFVMVSM